MANDNNELKNNAPCEEKQEARELSTVDVERYFLFLDFPGFPSLYS